MAYTTINKSTEHFNTKLYTGDGVNGRSLTGVGFQPDFTWTKCRSHAADHGLQDAVRGVGKVMHSNSTTAQGIDNWLTAFNSDGFTLSNSNEVNQSSRTFAAWNWKAGGGQGSSNTAGSINTTYTSANTTAGFSISTYTATGSAATIGHGLNSAPKMIIIKPTNAVGIWIVWHTGLNIKGQVQLNATQAEYVHSGNIYWNNTLPTSSVFSIGTSGSVNSSGTEYLAYCFADVKGYSKFGTYTGNGNADGTFVYTGFKPAFVLLKNITDASDWNMKDSKRPGYNQINDILYPNLNNAEEHGGDIDIVSNGFKIRTTAANTNDSGSTYIYMAFAEAPLVGSNGVTAKAR